MIINFNLVIFNLKYIIDTIVVIAFAITNFIITITLLCYLLRAYFNYLYHLINLFTTNGKVKALYIIAFVYLSYFNYYLSFCNHY